MFFVLSKVLFYLVMPLTLIVILLLLAFFSRREIYRKRSLSAALILLLFFTNPFITNEAWLLWELPPTPLNQMKPYDAAIILTGISNQNKSPHDRIYTGEAADRVLHPLRLYKAHLIKKIIISGGSGSLVSRYSTEAAEIKRLLVVAGIPGQDILLEEKSRNTYENALYTKALLHQQPELKNLLLVSSAFHMRRASACFEKQGIKADLFSTDFRTTDRSFTPTDLLVPQELYLYRWQILMHEMLGYLVYQLVGYC